MQDITHELQETGSILVYLKCLVSYHAKFTVSDIMKTNAPAIITHSHLCWGGDVIVLALVPSCGCTGKGEREKIWMPERYQFLLLILIQLKEHVL